MRHVRRLLNCLAHERWDNAGGPPPVPAPAAAPMLLALYVSGTGAGEEGNTCDDAAVVSLQGDEKQLAHLSAAVLEQLRTVSLALDHVVCERKAGGGNKALAACHAPQPSGQQREAQVAKLNQEAQVAKLNLPAAAPTAACRVRAVMPSLSVAAQSWAAGVRTAHDKGLVVAATQLLVASCIPSATGTAAAQACASEAHACKGQLRSVLGPARWQAHADAVCTLLFAQLCALF